MRVVGCVEKKLYANEIGVFFCDVVFFWWEGQRETR